MPYDHLAGLPPIPVGPARDPGAPFRKLSDRHALLYPGRSPGFVRSTALCPGIGRPRSRLSEDQFPHMAVGEREFGEIQGASAFEVIEQDRGPPEGFLVFRYPVLDGLFGR